MDKWNDKFNKMVLKEEEEVNQLSQEAPEEAPDEVVDAATVEALNDPIYQVATAAILILNGKHDEQDEEAMQFLELVKGLSVKYKAKFEELVASAEQLDGQEAKGKVNKMLGAVEKLQKALKDVAEMDQEQTDTPTEI